MTLVLAAVAIGLGPQPLVALDATVAPGEVLTIMGPSGSGKSTLLAAVAGDLAPAFGLSGRILLDGRDITARPTRDRRVGMLFQDDVLFPHLSVGGNLAFALPARRGDRRARIDAALAQAGLEGMADRDPATLSGGQRARVALMRTLLAEPRALLLDEPFSRLDAARRAQIRAFVFDRARRAGLPVLLVTHDAEDARAAGGRVLDPLGRPLTL
ncbi:ATP-binding cassette domain-containing protein [Rhodobaculum claviforme]|uniref:ABC transporter ATP-binding protein n=1 Tax=Rhodobaculum claviforme TaxID=1549854 RepID=A0A934TG37_9RHOB|nr:ATP-binding cassette domain-containing protein [Rhodobaculum claviforme]MBK5926060.1 ABC transporter ATP-binding protein [Rhodobaculum claviforme]